MRDGPFLAKSPDPKITDEQFVRAFQWDGKELTKTFEVDFLKEKLGRAHHMKFGTKSVKAAYAPESGERVAVADARQ